MRRDTFVPMVANTVGLSIVCGLFSVAYLALVEGGIHAIWGDVESSEWFSAPIYVLVIPVVAGLAVGSLYRHFDLPTRFKGFIDELEEGEVEPRLGPWAALVAVVSLVGGASLGPEGPLGTGTGAMGTWLARRRGWDEEQTRTATFVGMSAAFGGLLSSPLAGPLIAFELEHEQSRSYYFNHLIPGVVAGGIGLGIVYPLLGAPFLSPYGSDPTEFRSWMLLAAVGVGLAGAIVALVVGRILTSVVALFRRLDGRPVVRGLTGGVCVAVIGFAMPLTLFSGQTGMGEIFSETTTIATLTLVALIILKAVSLGASLGAGFYGGPIFPMFLMGGALGVLLHQLIPALPLELAVAGSMAALGSALAFIPLSMAILASLLVGTEFLMAGAVMISAATGFAVRYALTIRTEVGSVQQAARATEAAER